MHEKWILCGFAILPKSNILRKNKFLLFKFWKIDVDEKTSYSKLHCKILSFEKQMRTRETEIETMFASFAEDSTENWNMF